MKTLILIICGLVLVGCKSSAPSASAIPQADLKLSCAQIASMLQNSGTEVSRLEDKKLNSFSLGSYFNTSAKIMAENPLAGVGALIVFPFMFDRFTEDDEIELAAETARIEHYDRVARHKQCPGHPEPKRSGGPGDVIQALDLIF